MLYNLPETGVTDACQRAWLQKVLRNPVCGVLPARAGTWSRHCSSTSAASRSTSPSPAPHVVAGAYGKTPREKSSGKAPGKFCPTRRRRSLAARSGLLPGQLSRRAALQRRACPRRCRGGTLVGRRRGSGREGEGVRGVLRADPEQRVRLAVAWPPLKLGGPRAQRARPQVGGGGAGGLSQRARSCTNGARRRAVGWGGSVLRRRHMPHAHAHAHALPLRISKTLGWASGCVLARERADGTSSPRRNRGSGSSLPSAFLCRTPSGIARKRERAAPTVVFRCGPETDPVGRER